MFLLPPLPTMLSSASVDLSKLWLDLKGWPAATELLRKHGLTPTTAWGRRTTSLALIVANGFVDWYLREDTPTARFLKDIVRDIPSEMMSRFWNDPGISHRPGAAPESTHPLLQLEPAELKQFLTCVRGMDHAAQLRLRLLMATVHLAELKVLARADTEDLATLVDLLEPPRPETPANPGGPSVGDRLQARLDRLADFLVPGISGTATVKEKRT